MSREKKMPGNLCAFLLGLCGTLVLQTLVEGKGVLSETSIEGQTLQQFKDAGWSGYETATDFKTPTEFKSTLGGFVSTDRVWVENNTNYNQNSATYFTYIFDTSEICEVTSASLSIQFYTELATVYFYPCESGSNSEYCYLEPPSEMKWSLIYKHQLVIPLRSNKIEIAGILLPGGYVIFEEVTITYDGNYGEGCVTTTTTVAKSTDMTTSDTTEETPGPETTPTEELPTSTITTIETTTTDSTTPMSTTEDPEQSESTEIPSTTEASTPEITTTVASTPDLTTEASTPEITTEASTPEITTEVSTPEITTTEASTPELTTEASTPEITTTEASTPELTTEASTPEITTTEASSTTQDPDACDHDCEYIGIDCHNYYSCINYTRKEYFECNFEDGLAFNPTLKVCDRIENVEGCRPTTTELPTTPPEQDCVCEYKPHETDCSKYYFCPDSCRPSSCELRVCPGGLLWSVDYYGDESVHQQCKIPDKANCVSDGGGGARLEFSCFKKADGFYPDDKDCRSYWKCVEGRAQLYDCSKGYIYNADRQACDMAARSSRFCTNNEKI